MRAFAAAGIAVLPHKDQLLAQVAYGNRAIALLTELGYRTAEDLAWLSAAALLRWTGEMVYSPARHIGRSALAADSESLQFNSTPKACSDPVPPRPSEELKSPRSHPKSIGQGGGLPERLLWLYAPARVVRLTGKYRARCPRRRSHLTRLVRPHNHLAFRPPARRRLGCYECGVTGGP